MKRINVIYEGAHYSIGDRELSAVEAEIEEAVASGRPHWLNVNHGEGALRKTRLLIMPGVSIALMGIDPEEPETGHSPDARGSAADTASEPLTG